MEDIKGILRGRCSLCPCEQYKRSSAKEKVRCGECDHVPTKHEKLGRSVQTDGPSAARSKPAVHLTLKKYPPGKEEEEKEEEEEEEEEEEVEEVIEDVACSRGFLCSYQGCKNPSYFDVNTGKCLSAYCEKHINLLLKHSLQAGISFSSVPYTIPQQQCKLPGCSRPAYIDPDTNVTYDCCSKSHGRKLLEREQLRLRSTGQTPNTSMPPGLKCQNPWCDRKRYQEPSSGTVYDFCGTTCRDNYRKLQKDGRGVTIPQSSKLCCLPGCKLPRHLNPSGECLKFCGNSHKSQAQRQVLLELTSDNKHYKKTLAYFTSQWNVKKSAPPSSRDVMMIFKIFNPKQKNIFTQYTQSLSPNTKTEKYFHGTSIICDVKTQKAACSNQKCGACGISSRGFDKKLIGSNIPRFMRFGKGFYLAPNSSKCHDYTQGIVDYRVMLLCEVAPGNKYTVTNDQTQLKGPPQGYDSVYGAKGGALNYDEIVLYCSDSILPKYVIVYKRDGIKKIAQ